MHDCPFCPTNPELAEEVLARNVHWLLIQTSDSVLASSVIIVILRHVLTPFDFTLEEWLPTRELLIEAKHLQDRERPHGYSIGWNVHPVGGQSVPHVHLPVIARFADSRSPVMASATP